MARAQSERQLNSTTPYERPTHSRGNRPEEQRDSAFQSFSRSISHAFSRAVGRVSGRDPDPNDGIGSNRVDRDETFERSSANRNEPSAISDSTAEEVNLSQASKAPATLIRDVSAGRKPSIDISLLKRQSDLRVPAHLIIDAYREALRQRADRTPAKKLQHDDRSGYVANKPNVKLGDSALPARETVSTISQLNNSSSIARRPPGVSKQRKKPLNHRIQLITKPMIDLSQIPDDRRHRPGFISANFDLSDDDSDDKSENEAAASPAPSANTAELLLRRPQKESNRLKQTADRPKSLKRTATASHNEEKIPEFSVPSSEKSSEPSESRTKPVFSFSHTERSSANQSGQPAKPLFGLTSSTSSSSDTPSRPLDKNTAESFSFPLAGKAPPANETPSSASDTDAKPKPIFSFGVNGPGAEKAASAAQLSNAATSGASASLQPSKSTSGFNFGQPGPSADNTSQAANNDAPKFSFGAPSGSNGQGSGSHSINGSLKFNFGGSAAVASEGPKEPTKRSPPPSIQSNNTGAGSFTFGKPPSDAKAESKESGASAPSFVFGANTAATSAPEKKAETSQFNFGAPNSAAPASFAFGNTNPKSNNSDGVSGASGAERNTQDGALNASKPLFGGTPVANDAFGGQQPQQPSSFGLNTTPAATGAKFSFGSTEKSSSNGATIGTFGVNPGLGQSAGGTAPSLPGNDVNGGAPFQFGKAASQPPTQSSAFSVANKSTTPQPFSFGTPTAANGAGTPSHFGGGAFGSGAPKNAPGGPQPPAAPFVASNSGTPAPTGFGAFQAPAGNLAAPTAPGPSAFMSGSNNGTPQPQNAQLSSRESTPGTGIPARRIAQVKRRLNRK